MVIFSFNVLFVLYVLCYDVVFFFNFNFVVWKFESIVFICDCYVGFVMDSRCFKIIFYNNVLLNVMCV